jgi:hypothetical protein
MAMSDATDREDEPVASVDDIEICPGCGLMGNDHPSDVCWECFNKRNFWQGGGPSRYVELEGDRYHERPDCPEMYEGPYSRWSDESCMYSELSGELDRCPACESFYALGFRPERGEA